MIANLWPALKIIIAFNCVAKGSDVQVDNTGYVHEQGEKDSCGAYHFGPTSTETLQLKPWSVLNQLFPNTSQSLADAWGKNPLFISSSATEANWTDTATAFSTVFNDLSPDRFSKLFSVDDSLTVLSDPNLIHGRDYFILKYLLRDGEEWNGQLPDEKVPLQSIPLLIQQKSFSLVINNLQRRWKPIKDFARSLEMEINPHAVVCNLYLTPPRASRAFESHIDWMDVIVLQVSGEKDWSVWNAPFIYLVPPDQKRKPTMNELYKKQFENVRMKPGDVLYIPRGNLHNATTPKDSNDMSLHLTFGIQYDFYATMESLLHHAVVMFRAEYKVARSIAVRSRSCGGNSLTFDKLLHFSISEVVRRTNCGGFGEPRVMGGVNKDGNKQGNICNMRKSVPLHPEWKKLSGRSDNEIRDQYVNGLETILQQISVMNTLDFVNKISQGGTGISSLGSNSFTYVGMKKNERYQCRLEKDEIDDLEKEFMNIASTFVEFAKKMFTEARQNLIQTVESDRLSRWENEDAMLNYINTFGTGQ